MRKLKKSLKKNRGLEARIERQEFYHALKNGQPKKEPNYETSEILRKIRNRNRAGGPPVSSPIDQAMKKIRKLAGLE